LNTQKQGSGQGVVTRPVEKDDDGARLDRWFKRHYPGVSHVQLEKLLRKGEVRLDGKRARASDRVAAGQMLRLPPQVTNAPARDRRQPAKPPLANHDKDVIQSLAIHKDSSVIVLNKPSGLATQGGSGLTRHIDGMLDALAFGKKQRPRLVHRLDRDTSGVLVVARTVPAAAALAESLRRRDASKIYWALVKGVPRPPAGTIKLALAKEGGHGPHGRDERMVAADRHDDDAKHAVTDYAVMGQAGQKYAWVAARPVTGRTHQIRAHLAAIGHPIVGDFKYGGAEARGMGEIADRLHLHARAIDIAHPDGGRLRAVAPLPDHMLKTWRLLGFDPASPTDPFTAKKPRKR
jgi:23S rRNA pseudouridine955/2504/2580 synthase